MPVLMKLLTALLIFFSVYVIGLFVTHYTDDYFSEETFTAKVIEKEKVGYGGDTRSFRIYTDKEVVDVEYSDWKSISPSYEIYHSVDVGKTYTFTVWGWKGGIFGAHRNVKTIVPLN